MAQACCGNSVLWLWDLENARRPNQLDISDVIQNIREHTLINCTCGGDHFSKGSTVFQGASTNGVLRKQMDTLLGMSNVRWTEVQGKEGGKMHEAEMQLARDMKFVAGLTNGTHKALSHIVIIGADTDYQNIILDTIPMIPTVTQVDIYYIEGSTNKQWLTGLQCRANTRTFEHTQMLADMSGVPLTFRYPNRVIERRPAGLPAASPGAPQNKPSPVNGAGLSNAKPQPVQAKAPAQQNKPKNKPQLAAPNAPQLPYAVKVTGYTPGVGNSFPSSWKAVDACKTKLQELLKKQGVQVSLNQIFPLPADNPSYAVVNFDSLEKVHATVCLSGLLKVKGCAVLFKEKKSTAPQQAATPGNGAGTSAAAAASSSPAVQANGHGSVAADVPLAHTLHLLMCQADETVSDEQCAQVVELVRAFHAGVWAEHANLTTEACPDITLLPAALFDAVIQCNELVRGA